jgi:hypothetical protein
MYIKMPSNPPEWHWVARLSTVISIEQLARLWCLIVTSSLCGCCEVYVLSTPQQRQKENDIVVSSLICAGDVQVLVPNTA